MIIAICGSIKFFKQMKEAEANLIKLGHKVFVPVAVPGVDYWEKDGKKRVEAKIELDLIGKHMRKIEKSDAILVANITKSDIKNYIGANTFLEMGYAYYLKKKIFCLNPLPDQPYISDELVSFKSTILNGNLSKI